MTFESEANRLQQQGIVGALALIGANGQIFWKTENWNVDGNNIIEAWTNKAPSVIVQGVKYSTIDINNNRMVCTNVRQQGHIVIAKTPFWQGFIMAWCSPQNQVRHAYTDIAKLANQVKQT